MYHFANKNTNNVFKWSRIIYSGDLQKKKKLSQIKIFFFVKCRLSSSATKLKTFGQRHFIDKARRVQMASNNAELSTNILNFDSY